MVRHQPHRQDDHVELFLDNALLRPRLDVGQPNVLTRRILFQRTHLTAHEAHATHVLGSGVERLEPFAESSQVRVEDRRLDRALVLFGDDGLFGCVHAADRGAVVLSRRSISGAHALDPGDRPRSAPVRRPLQMSFVRTRGTENALELHAAYYVGVTPKAVLGLQRRVELLVAIGQDDGPNSELDLPVRHTVVNGIGLARFDALEAETAPAAGKTPFRLPDSDALELLRVGRTRRPEETVPSVHRPPFLVELSFLAHRNQLYGAEGLPLQGAIDGNRRPPAGCNALDQHIRPEGDVAAREDAGGAGGQSLRVNGDVPVCGPLDLLREEREVGVLTDGDDQCIDRQ